MRKCFLFILLAAHALAAESAPAIDRLAALFTGTFSSAEQALADKNYRHVVLHVVQIWPDRRDGPWLYLEQALVEAPEQPYRQRVYQLTASLDGTLEVRVFSLDDPIRATGAWRRTAPLSDSVPAHLTFQEGCSLFLREMPDGSFVGGTRGDGCASDLRGATHATTELTLTADRLISWERGFNASGRQVWGAATGGYVFRRIALP